MADLPDESDGGALTILWGVTAVVAVAFAIFLAMALNWEPPAALLGLGGLFVGALLATTYQLSKNRKRGRPAPEAVNALMDRMQVLELEQQRVAELEERVEFAERMLGRVQAEAPLLNSRRMPGPGA